MRDEDRRRAEIQRTRLRVGVSIVLLALIVVLALTDSFGKPLGVGVSDFVFAACLSALFVTMGLEVRKP